MDLFGNENNDVTLAHVIATQYLQYRESRIPNFNLENKALLSLSHHMTKDNSHTLLNRLAALAQELCVADTAGLSLIKQTGTEESLTAQAVAGVHDHLAGSIVSRAFSPCGTCIDSGTPQLFHYPDRYFVYLKDLNPLIVEALVVPIYGNGDKALGTLWIASHREHHKFDNEDVRVLKDLSSFSAMVLELITSREALGEALIIRDNFISMCSHELSAPLASLKLRLALTHRHLSKAPYWNADEARRTLWQFSAEVDRLIWMVNDMLDVTRIQSKQLEIKKEPVDLADLVFSVCQKLHQEGQDAGPVIDISQSDHILGKWDRMRMEQVITNLVSNASKYGENKPIQIQIRRNRNWAELAVIDSGIGIAPADQQRIFNIFERVAVSSKTGLGLGLFIVKRIVEAHGGQVHLVSDKGCGSTFTITLPLE